MGSRSILRTNGTQAVGLQLPSGQSMKCLDGHHWCRPSAKGAMTLAMCPCTRMGQTLATCSAGSMGQHCGVTSRVAAVPTRTAARAASYKTALIWQDSVFGRRTKGISVGASTSLRCGLQQKAMESTLPRGTPSKRTTGQHRMWESGDSDG